MKSNTERISIATEITTEEQRQENQRHSIIDDIRTNAKWSVEIWKRMEIS